MKELKVKNKNWLKKILKQLLDLPQVKPPTQWVLQGLVLLLKNDKRKIELIWLCINPLFVGYLTKK